MPTVNFSVFEAVSDRITAACDRSGRHPNEITIVGVTKGHPAEVLSKARALGLTDIGESKVQEAYRKYELTVIEGQSLSFRFHMIGQLQSNKVKRAVQVFNCIDTIDSYDTVVSVDKQCAEVGKRMRVLVQVNTSDEAQKSGVAPEGAKLLGEQILGLQNIDFQGFMTMGPLEGTERTIRKSFMQLRELRDQMCQELKIQELPVLSMGMSGDFEWAIEEGATEVRLGTVLWGAREQ